MNPAWSERRFVRWLRSVRGLWSAAQVEQLWDRYEAWGWWEDLGGEGG